VIPKVHALAALVQKETEWVEDRRGLHDRCHIDNFAANAAPAEHVANLKGFRHATPPLARGIPMPEHDADHIPWEKPALAATGVINLRVATQFRDFSD